MHVVVASSPENRISVYRNHFIYLQGVVRNGYYKMLILSRRSSESIIVGDEVTITILSVKGKQVRIGIDAPSHIGVHREEIYQKIQDQDAPASEPGALEADSGTTAPVAPSE